jgi:pimeloyl-ACP methyl ester carboxylesterase
MTPRNMIVRFALVLSVLSFSIGCTRLHPKVIQVDGRDVEVVQTGTGTTTVVFESGLGNDWAGWDEVASEVAKHTRVFAYSRPGYGQSEAPTTPRDATHIAEELRALLVAQGVPPPYVLVGHSFGGAYMELFAKTHPEEVAGVVLVDPRHRDFGARCQAAHLDLCTLAGPMSKGLPKVQVDEIDAYEHVSYEIAAAGSFGEYPVTVLIATVHGGSAARETLWESLLASLAQEAPHGHPIVLKGAGHVLQYDRPKDVEKAIVDVLSQVQN